ncbi:hypothetical protein [Methylobacterium sp. SD21]|uniref:hypothetical protein n=1 Tax=Methylobacterium litchii TaxID=3138810 RepID=UPI00313E8794
MTDMEFIAFDAPWWVSGMANRAAAPAWVEHDNFGGGIGMRLASGAVVRVSEEAIRRARGPRESLVDAAKRLVVKAAAKHQPGDAA